MPLQDLMISSGNIERPTVTVGTSMGTNKSWVSVAQNCPVRICPHNARKMDLFDQKVEEISHRLHFSPVQDIRIKDRFVVTGGSAGIGEIYEILGSFNPDQMNRFQVCFAKKVSA